MATYAYGDAYVGYKGVLRCEIQLKSQDAANKKSTIQCRGYIWLQNGGPSGDMTGGCKQSFSGDVSYGPVSGSFSNISYPEKRLMLARDFVVSHNADGTKTVTARYNFGPTVTQNFGSGGTAIAKLVLPSLSSTPAPMPNPTLKRLSADTVRVSWSKASSTDPIDYYVLAWTNETGQWWQTTNKQVVVGPDVYSYDVTGLTMNSTWRFATAAHNKNGWGEPYAYPGAQIFLDARGPMVKINGNWRGSQAYGKVAGNWRQADGFIRKNGVWQPL